MHQVQEVGIDRLAVVTGAALRNVDCSSDLAFVGGHNVHDVLYLVYREAILAANVDMNACANLGIADRTCVAELPEEFLQDGNVVPAEDWGDKLGLIQDAELMSLSCKPCYPVRLPIFAL